LACLLPARTSRRCGPRRLRLDATWPWTPDLLSKGERRRLRKLELQAARRRIAREPSSRSSRRERATYGLIAELCARQSRRREDWLHKTTTNLAKSHGPIALEDLHVKNMTRSARGSMKQAGVNVRAKAGMNRSILGMAWGTVERICVEMASIEATPDGAGGATGGATTGPGAPATPGASETPGGPDAPGSPHGDPPAPSGGYSLDDLSP